MFNTQDDNISTDDYDLETEIGKNGRAGFVKRDQNQDWLNDDYEGQLSVDVYQTDKDIVVKSTIAGIRPEDIDITINNDMITIRGSRRQETEVEEDDYLFQECYWGSFSRSIILPQPVKQDKVKATLENGILTVYLPKAPQTGKVNVKVKSASKIKKEVVGNIRKGGKNA